MGFGRLETGAKVIQVAPLGPRGSTGERGSTGSDAIGTTGSTGSTGPAGTTGSTGAGTTGSTGERGSTGSQGDRGSTGSQGPAGSTGSQGERGSTGSAGSDGAVGTTGSAGAVGATGSQGERGSTGSQGERGSTGSAGAAGDRGSTGSAGAAGDRGSTGSAGAVGSTGSQGDRGSTGSAGSDGAVGSTGSAGAVGSTGSQGERGSTGSAGAVGSTGSQGDRGSTGSQGDRGSTGSSVVGSTGSAGSTGSTGASEASDSVFYRNFGDAGGGLDSIANNPGADFSSHWGNGVPNIGTKLKGSYRLLGFQEFNRGNNPIYPNTTESSSGVFVDSRVEDLRRYRTSVNSGNSVLIGGFTFPKASETVDSDLGTTAAGHVNQIPPYLGPQTFFSGPGSTGGPFFNNGLFGFTNDQGGETGNTQGGMYEATCVVRFSITGDGRTNDANTVHSSGATMSVNLDIRGAVYNGETGGAATQPLGRMVFETNADHISINVPPQTTEYTHTFKTIFGRYKFNVDATPEETPHLIFGVEVASLLEQVATVNGGPGPFDTTGGGNSARKTLGAVAERHIPRLLNAQLYINRLGLQGNDGNLS